MIIRRLALPFVLVLSTMLVFVACGGPDPTPTAAAPTATPPPAAPSFQQEWDDLVSAAEEEGELVIFLSHLLSRSSPAAAFEEAFESRFDIDMVPTIRGTSTQKWERISAERQAGLFSLDVWLGGSSISNQLLLPADAMLPLKPLLIDPEILDASLWFQGTLPWMTEEKRWSLAFITIPSGANAAYNPDLVNPDEITSFQDYLDPKYRTTLLPRSQSLLFIFEILGEDYMREIHAKSFIPPNLRQAVDLVAAGEMDMVLWGSGSEIREAQGQGLPIQNLTKALKEGESLSVGGHTLMLMESAPHPNAQKLFANWILSKDGMMVVQEITKADVMRIDIPKDNVEPEDRRVEGRTYVFLEGLPDFTAKLNEATSLWDLLQRGG